MGGVGGVGDGSKGGSSRSGGAVTTSSATGSGGGNSTVGLSTEYEANKPQVMPVYNSPSQIESARKKRMEIMARSGRTSTNLRGNPGTQTYQNSFLGNVS